MDSYRAQQVQGITAKSTFCRAEFQAWTLSDRVLCPQAGLLPCGSQNQWCAPLIQGGEGAMPVHSKDLRIMKREGRKDYLEHENQETTKVIISAPSLTNYMAGTHHLI